jgi:hypothetical protein
MPWKVTVRIGPKVDRSTHPDRDQALDAVEAHARELGRTARTRGVDLKYKRYAPGEQVSARIELSGPQRLLPSVRAGVDIRGDGSSQAFIGRVQRRLIESRKGETAAQALRRALQDQGRSVTP